MLVLANVLAKELALHLDDLAEGLHITSNSLA
mgnify:CR=1 FL=1